MMLKNNEPYRYAKPELMLEVCQAPWGRHAVRPRGQRHRPRAKAGSGLAEVYRSAQLPPATGAPADLPVGERRMLAERELGDFVRGLYEGKSPDSGAEPAEDQRPGGRAKVNDIAPQGPPGGAAEMRLCFIYQE